MAWAGYGTCRKDHSPSASSFLQSINGQAQEKLSPLALLKLGNQVQPGGAGEEWAGPEGEGPISRGEETGRCGCEAEPQEFRGQKGEGRKDPLVTLPLPPGLGGGPAIIRHRVSEGDIQCRTWS